MAPLPRDSNGGGGDDDNVDQNKDGDKKTGITMARLKDGKDGGKDDDNAVHAQRTKDAAVVSEKMPSSTVLEISSTATAATATSTATATATATATKTKTKTTSAASATGIKTANNQKNASENNQIGDPNPSKKNNNSGLSVMEDHPQNPQLQIPGAFAVRGINSVQSTENVHTSIEVLVASVVDEEETERRRLGLIAETEARVRLEISEKQIVEAEIVGSFTDSQEETAKKKRNRKIELGVVGLIFIIIATAGSILLTRNTGKQSSAAANTSAAANNTELPTASPILETVCVDEKLQEWVGLNTTLKQFFDDIMSTDLYKTISEDCMTEINAYTQSTEKSCQLEIEYDSPFNYGDFWLASTSIYKQLNDGSDNGAIYLDGHYRLATILDTTVTLTETFPNPFVSYADCYMGTGGRCDSLYALATTDDDYNPNNVTTWFVEPEKFLSPQLYCNVGWETVDQSYIDLKICASRSAKIDLTDTYDVYDLSYETEKKKQQKSSQEYCGREFLQRRQCGNGKLNSFLDFNSILRQYFDVKQMDKEYKQAAESCQNEIDAFTEIADTSCYLENLYNSSWNYGDRWLATNSNFAMMNQGSTNGAIYMDGNYMLQAILIQTLRMTIPLSKPHICLADCYTGMTWNGDGDTCDLYDSSRPLPEGLNPFKLDSLFVPQSTISAEMYCNIEWKNVDLAVSDLKICAARAIGNPFLMTQDEYVCFFEYEKLRNRKCSEYYCDEDFSSFDITLEDYCQLSPDLMDTIYSMSGM